MTVLDTIKDRLLSIDPVWWAEKYLTLDGKPFRINSNGYKPYSDIFRLIGIKLLEKDSLPIVILKSRQTGGTTMASALEMFFMGCGLFGTGDRPPIRIVHAFPQLDLAYSYSKVKLNNMISSSIVPENQQLVRGQKPKSHMQSLLDPTSPTNDSLQFKQFIGGNHLFIESTGIDGGRLRGKQLALDTELPTPNGFTKLIDIKEGDKLFDENGNECNVIKIHPINISPESYQITFDDDTIVQACAEHLWKTYTKSNRSAMMNLLNNKTSYVPELKIKTTKEIFNTLKVCKVKESNHSIANCLPINYQKKELIVDPYLLGLWLGDGDGNGCIESADPEIFNNYEHRIIKSSIGKSKSCAYRVIGLTSKLRKLGLLINNHKRKNNVYKKYIPNDYLYSSFEQRLSLVQGLMDTDGSCDKNGRAEFCSVNEELAYGVYQLLLSLGIKAHINESESWLYDKRYKNRFRINFVTRLPVFRLDRKLKNIKTNNKAIFMSTHRYIVDIKKIDPIPMRCITVDSASKLFLITRKFIPTHNTADVIFADECQLMPAAALSNSIKILNKAQYGAVGSGVQVYFGTPLQRSSEFFQMWNQSSQQYYHLGCEKCKKHFPLYTPGSNEWEDIWLYGFIVRCTHCGHEQDKRPAAERGKWVSIKNSSECRFHGFHINQLYMPEITKEKIISEKPGISAINTERAYQNEVLGEFYHGEASIITPEQIRELCGDPQRKFRANISPAEDLLVFLGIDIGAKNDLEQLVDSNRVKSQGQSYSTAVVIAMTGPNRMSIEFATKFKRNDLASKKGLIDQIMRQYSCNLAVCDIGFANDLNEILQKEYGDKFLTSQSLPRVNDHVKFNNQVFPKIIAFEKDHWIAEMYEQMKKGSVRFPLGDYEKIAWLIQHCTSMEIKPSISRTGDIMPHYVKGSQPNDGFMALLNAYIAYKFYVSNGFEIKNPFLMEDNQQRKAPILGGYIPRLK
jgi:hypothetical protein